MGNTKLTVEYDVSEYIIENLKKIGVQTALAILILFAYGLVVYGSMFTH